MITNDLSSLQKLSQNKYLTTEGFLIIRNARVSRTGTQQYLAHEIGVDGIKGDKNGVVTAVRNANEVFDVDSLESFIGKSITVNHPTEDVNQGNWQRYEVGTVLAARHDPITNTVNADFIIKDPDTVAQLKYGNSQLSAGYHAQYSPIDNETVEQTDIAINHIALVPEGRAGALCSTRDSMPVTLTITKESKMKTLTDTVVAAVKSIMGSAEHTDTTADAKLGAKEEPKMDSTEEMETTEDTAVTFDAAFEIQTLKDTIAQLMDAMPKNKDGSLVKWAKEEEEEPEHSDMEDAAHSEEGETEEEDEEESTEEEAEDARRGIEDSIATFKAQAAIIAPGFQSTINDSLHSFKDSLSACQVAALMEASKGKNKDTVAAILKDRDLMALDATVTGILMDAVTGAVTAINNQKLVADGVTTSHAGRSTTWLESQAAYWAKTK